MENTSHDLEDICLHFLFLLSCKLIAVEVGHYDVGQDAQQVGLENEGNAIGVDC